MKKLFNTVKTLVKYMSMSGTYENKAYHMNSRSARA